GEGDFGLEDVAESGEHGLIEEGAAEFEIALGGELRNGDGGVEMRIERGWAQAVKTLAARQGGSGVELGHRDVEGDGQHRRGLHHDAHVGTVPLPLFAGTVNVPT